jgi:hypothetical protein
VSGKAQPGILLPALHELPPAVVHADAPFKNVSTTAGALPPKDIAKDYDFSVARNTLIVPTSPVAVHRVSRIMQGQGGHGIAKMLETDMPYPDEPIQLCSGPTHGEGQVHHHTHSMHNSVQLVPTPGSRSTTSRPSSVIPASRSDPPPAAAHLDTSQKVSTAEPSPSKSSPKDTGLSALQNLTKNETSLMAAGQGVSLMAQDMRDHAQTLVCQSVPVLIIC